jgi:hypothetical protein
MSKFRLYSFGWVGVGPVRHRNHLWGLKVVPSTGSMESDWNKDTQENPGPVRMTPGSRRFQKKNPLNMVR